MARIFETKTNCQGYSTLDSLIQRLEMLKKESVEQGDNRRYKKLNRVISKMKSDPDLVYCEDVKMLMKQLRY